MKTINQLTEEIKRDGITEPSAVQIELYKRLYDEAKEAVNIIAYAPDTGNVKTEDVVIELLHIVNIFSYSTDREFSRKDFAEDLKAHLFRLTNYHEAILMAWLTDELGERANAEEVAAR